MKRIVKAPDERRSELIACAQRLFYSKGYEGTSINDIVREVGVAKGTFYYYFDSKQAVLEALVDDLTAQSLALYEAIVADDALSAIQKWTRAVQVIGDWKIERRAELLTLTRVLQTDENVLLRYKLRTQARRVVAPELAKIIAQGVEEGVFETAYAEEIAEAIYAVSTAFSETITDILLNPDDYDDPEALARRKIAAVQTAIERVLGAAPGSLPVIDEQALCAWFEE
jgi:AcrR family transcriptional regulator